MALRAINGFCTGCITSKNVPFAKSDSPIKSLSTSISEEYSRETRSFQIISIHGDYFRYSKERLKLKGMFEDAYERCRTATMESVSFSLEDFHSALEKYVFNSEIGTKGKAKPGEEAPKPSDESLEIQKYGESVENHRGDLTQEPSATTTEAEEPYPFANLLRMIIEEPTIVDRFKEKINTQSIKKRKGGK